MEKKIYAKILDMQKKYDQFSAVGLTPKQERW